MVIMMVGWRIEYIYMGSFPALVENKYKSETFFSFLLALLTHQFRPVKELPL